MMQPEAQKWLDRTEIEAVEASLPDVGRLVAELEQGRPISQWSREEVLRLIAKAYSIVGFHREEIIQKECPPWEVIERAAKRSEAA